MSDPPRYSAEHVLSYDYRRSVGPVLGRFFTELRDQKILGSRAPNGRVLVPPVEYDPETGEALDELVEVGSAGTVTSWAWVHEPRAMHPFERPFAWALIQLDGATTSLVHAVDADGPEAMKTGMRVKARWSAERIGRIQDIECFEPEGA
jgi:uncharacterized OB-fold protein